MNTQRLSAILLIVGFAVLILGTLLGPPGIYDTEDPQRRVQIIEEYQTRWNIAQPANALSLLFTAAGFAVLASRLGKMANGWIPGMGAAAFVVGTISAEIFLFRQTTDPLNTYGGAYSTFENLYYWLALAGLLLFGVAFLMADLPAWLGYVTAGVALANGVFFLVTGAGFMTPFLVGLLSPVIAIVLLRQ